MCFNNMRYWAGDGTSELKKWQLVMLADILRALIAVQSVIPYVLACGRRLCAY